MKKLSKILFTSVLVFPVALNAEESFFKEKLPSMLKNIGNGFENGEGKEAIEAEAKDASLKAANDAIDSTEENILENSNFTYFDFNIGTDVLGLDGTDSEVTISPNTTSLEIAFKVTDMLSIENPNADYLQAYLDGFEISIEAN